MLKCRYEVGRRPSDDLAGWALSWQLTKNDEYAQRALTALRDSAEPPQGKATRYWMQYAAQSLAFDWLYQHPGFEAALKDRLANNLLDSAAKLLAAPDLAIPEQASYHNYTLRYLAIVCFTLAAVRGHRSTVARSADLRQRAQRAFQNILDTTQLVTPQGSYHESMDYFRITLAPLALLAELQRTTLGIDPARRFSVFQNVAATYLYKLMPDGTPSREGDNEYPVLDEKDTALLGYAVHRFQDPYAAWLLRESNFVPGKWVLPVLDFLWNDPQVVPRNPALAAESELPRQKFFPGVGHLVMRDGWQPDSVWIEFDCGPYFSKHQHLSQNHFSIYRSGYLAIDSGADYTDTESPHYLNYYRRTVAHNSILVYDPRERFFWSDNVVDAANDGGQRMDSARFWNTVRSVDDFHRTRDLWNLGEMRIVDYQPGYYHYALGDATHAYSPAKIRCFTRELLYFPASHILLVFDRVVSSDPTFKKVWLLHGVNEPLFTAPGHPVAHGGTDYAAAPNFRFQNLGGELFVHCLLPAQRSVLKRGGPGFEFWTPGNERGGDWGSGENWPLEPSAGGPLPQDPRLRDMWRKFWGDDFEKLQPSNRKNVVPGAWRVEVTPTVPATADLFLHALEIGASGSLAPRQVELLQGQNVAGAVFASGPAALFNTGPAALSEAELTLPALDCKELLVVGAKENSRYEVTFGGPNITTPESIAPPGVPAKTINLRANSQGVLNIALDGIKQARLRLQQI